jgi:hypothetical protein
MGVFYGGADAVNELRFDKTVNAVLDATGGPRPAEDEKTPKRFFTIPSPPPLTHLYYTIKYNLGQ